MSLKSSESGGLMGRAPGPSPEFWVEVQVADETFVPVRTQSLRGKHPGHLSSRVSSFRTGWQTGHRPFIFAHSRPRALLRSRTLLLSRRGPSQPVTSQNTSVGRNIADQSADLRHPRFWAHEPSRKGVLLLQNPGLSVPPLLRPVAHSSLPVPSVLSYRSPSSRRSWLVEAESAFCQLAQDPRLPPDQSRVVATELGGCEPCPRTGSVRPTWF
jgi:hypothetical protein